MVTQTNRFAVGIAAVLVLFLSGCGSLLHPRAGEFLAQAQGAGDQASSGVQTIVNLTTMLDASIQAARSGQNYEAALDRLHDQFHALRKAFCLVTEAQAATTAYAKAVTIRREMRTVFHRLWKFREDSTLREVHLDLFAKRLQELRETVQAIKS